MKDGIYNLSRIHLKTGVLEQFEEVVQRASPEIDKKYPEVKHAKAQKPKVRVLKNNAHLFIKVGSMEVRMPIGPIGKKWTER